MKENIITCDQCNGTGQTPRHVRCSKCKGKKVLDWLEDIFGTEDPKQFEIKFKDIDQTMGFDIKNRIINDLSQQLAKDIDKEIINELKSKENYFKNNYREYEPDK